jgi:hypothetical protein
MSIEFDAFVGRANARTIELLIDGVKVPDNSVTRVVIYLGVNCLDTDEALDPIELRESNTEVFLQAGLWDHAAPDSTMVGHMVVYDANSPEGLAWPEGETITVNFHAWSACDV